MRVQIQAPATAYSHTQQKRNHSSHEGSNHDARTTVPASKHFVEDPKFVESLLIENVKLTLDCLKEGWGIFAQELHVSRVFSVEREQRGVLRSQSALRDPSFEFGGGRGYNVLLLIARKTVVPA
jgi:hypothetical protein